MTLRKRLALLMVLLVLLPAIPAMWVTRQLVDQSLNVGLSSEVDQALESGVERARAEFQLQREIFRDEVDEWLEAPERQSLSGAELVATAGTPSFPGVGAKWTDSNGETTWSSADTESLIESPSAERRQKNLDEDSVSGGQETPSHFSARHSLSDGSVFTAYQLVSPEWREDAANLASTLQMVRGLQARRSDLEQGFLLPFLGIYGVALLLALAGAVWLGRGITEPTSRLSRALRSVSLGNWTERVPVRGRDEFAQLSLGFNRMLETLDAQSRQLLDLEKMASWREMARALAHEVKNPLTPIQLTVEEMSGRYDGDDPEYKKLLSDCSRIVVKEVQSLRNIVTKFREFSRPVEPSFEEFDLNELIAEVGNLQRDLQVELDLAPEVGRIEADPDRIRQVLMNLCRNAQEATRQTERPTLRLASRRSDNRIRIVVEDNGPGIAPSERAAVFEPYRTGRAEGLGLGLTLVKGIVIAHNGSIEVDEAEGGGAAFRIELPTHRTRSES